VKKNLKTLVSEDFPWNVVRASTSHVSNSKIALVGIWDPRMNKVVLPDIPSNTWNAAKKKRPFSIAIHNEHADSGGYPPPGHLGELIIRAARHTFVDNRSIQGKARTRDRHPATVSEAHPPRPRSARPACRSGR
jgi:hypothetical protein